MDLSIIIVNRNTKELLLACIESVYATAPPLSFELLLVDNASSDGSVVDVRHSFPDIRCIENDRNLGFAKANNIAIRQAQGRYVVLLNTDTVLTPLALATIVDFMDRNQKVAICGGQLLNGDGSLQNSIANVPTLATELLNKSLLRLLFPKRYPGKESRFNHPVEVESVVGACMVVAREAIDRVGLLDEAYFFFFEETDWCLFHEKKRLECLLPILRRAFSTCRGEPRRKTLLPPASSIGNRATSFSGSTTPRLSASCSGQGWSPNSGFRLLCSSFRPLSAAADERSSGSMYHSWRGIFWGVPEVGDWRNGPRGFNDMKVPVSCVLIAKNEEKAIAACLETLVWADEIVVVDSGSTDNTATIVRRFTDRIYDLPWLGFGPQKQAAVERASHDLILNVDCDERVTPELAAEIREIARSGDHCPGYTVPRRTFVGDKEIRYSGWYPDRTIRLFDRRRARFSDDLVHERVIVDGEVRACRHHLLHYSFAGIGDMLAKLARYSDLSSRQMFDNGKKCGLFDLTFRPLFAVMKTYILKKGFLDGVEGLEIAVTTGMLTFTKYAKLRELSQFERRQKLEKSVRTP